MLIYATDSYVLQLLGLLDVPKTAQPLKTHTESLGKSSFDKMYLELFGLAEELGEGQKVAIKAIEEQSEESTCFSRDDMDIDQEAETALFDDILLDCNQLRTNESSTAKDAIFTSAEKQMPALDVTQFTEALICFNNDPSTTFPPACMKLLELSHDKVGRFVNVIDVMHIQLSTVLENVAHIQWDHSCVEQFATKLCLDAIDISFQSFTLLVRQLLLKPVSPCSCIEDGFHQRLLD